MRATRGFGHGDRHGVGHAVGIADDEVLERERRGGARVQLDAVVCGQVAVLRRHREVLDRAESARRQGSGAIRLFRGRGRTLLFLDDGLVCSSAGRRLLGLRLRRSRLIRLDFRLRSLLGGGIDFDRDGELDPAQIEQSLLDVVEVVLLDPGFDELGVGGEHEEILAHRLGSEAREECRHLRGSHVWVALHLIADFQPGVLQLFAFHVVFLAERACRWLHA